MQDGDQGDLPGVSFVIPTLDAARLLPRCLATIREQDYAEDAVEILVMDGGSTDGTRELATASGAEVVDNPLKRAEPGVKLGFARARHELKVVMAADNGLPHRDWLRRMVGALQATGARGAFTHVVDAPTDGLACRYFNRLHADPFNWFVFGPAHTDPELYGQAYRVRTRGAHHVVYDLRSSDPPMLALAQGFVLRGDLPVAEDEAEDDIAPVWTLIDEGAQIVYVDAGVWHETVASFQDFLGKYHRRTLAALRSSAAPQRSRVARLGPAQRRRRQLWLAYSLTLVGPLADALRGVLRDRDAVWLLHPFVCVVFTLNMARAAGKIALERLRSRWAPDS
jgi:glycosyltransferase involved in cell wall biosynthesis